MIRSTGAGMLIAICASVAMSQDKGDKKVPFPLPEAAPRKDWEWDEDERFDELMEQLAINEASLDAVKVALAKKVQQKYGRSMTAKRLEENNRLMDRKGGGPVTWDRFYGMNAEKFFYHPVDPNTTYHTDTLLRQMGKAEDDKSGEDTPARQSLPVHQRPPQWDYIYRANKTASDAALADASIAAAEVERLEQRRTELEKEQAVLWCKLAFRAVQRLNMARKPVLRFELVPAAADDDSADHAAALSAAARFLAASLAVVEKAEQDQSVAFGGVATVVSQARESFEDSLLDASGLESEWESTQTDLGKFVKLSQMLADKAKTLAESYAGAMDGDMNREAARKERFRGMLQESVVEYAQILLALNELTDTIKADWKLRVDTKRKVEPLKVAWVNRPGGAGSATRDDGSSTRNPAAPETDGGAGATDDTRKVVIDHKLLRKAFGAAKASYDNKTSKLTLVYDFMREEQFRDWDVPDNAVTRLMQGKGIRISAATAMKHVALFREGTCTFAFAIRQREHSGDVVSAGGIKVRQGTHYDGRRWAFSRDKAADIPKASTLLQYRVNMAVEGTRCLLNVNGSEVAVNDVPSGAFNFVLHGGDNGADVGSVTISGHPDSEWFAGVLQR